MRKVTPAVAQQIRELAHKGLVQRDIASRLGLSKGSVGSVLKAARRPDGSIARAPSPPAFKAVQNSSAPTPRVEPGQIVAGAQGAVAALLGSLDGMVAANVLVAGFAADGARLAAQLVKVTATGVVVDQIADDDVPSPEAP